MTKRQAYTIQHQPNWKYEAAACFGEIHQNNLDSIIQNHSRFGMTKDEMHLYLSAYREYKEKVVPKMKELLSQYPKLSTLVIPSDDSNSMISSMYFYIGQLLESSTTEEIDKAVCSFIIDLIADNVKDDVDEASITIEDVSDLIQILAKTSLEDKDKLNIITLYTERYQRIPEILQFLREGGAICEKYQDLIIDHHQACIKQLEQQNELNLIRLKMDLDVPTTVSVCIFPFNQISVQRKANYQVIFIGMYVSFLSNQKETNRYQSEDVITALKALADPTRWKILSLLASHPMYLQEIANAMELSPATISHHVNLLVSSAFINIVFDAAKSKKVYYETNGKGLTDIASIISSFAQRSTEN